MMRRGKRVINLPLVDLHKGKSRAADGENETDEKVAAFLPPMETQRCRPPGAHHAARSQKGTDQRLNSYLLYVCESASPAIFDAAPRWPARARKRTATDAQEKATNRWRDLGRAGTGGA
jgi:hypothetical protein